MPWVKVITTNLPALPLTSPLMNRTSAANLLECFLLQGGEGESVWFLTCGKPPAWVGVVFRRSAVRTKDVVQIASSASQLFHRCSWCYNHLFSVLSMCRLEENEWRGGGWLLFLGGSSRAQSPGLIWNKGWCCSSHWKKVFGGNVWLLTDCEAVSNFLRSSFFPPQAPTPPPTESEMFASHAINHSGWQAICRAVSSREDQAC